MSYNAWLYVYANPINYVDPTGNIAEGAEATAADTIVNTLQDNYGVQIEKDWGYYLVPINPPLPFIMTGILYGCQWEDGQWKLGELQKVEQGVTDLANAMQGHFRGFIGPVTVISSSTSPCGSNFNGCTTGGQDIIFPPWLPDTWAVVHEFGHAWDRNYDWRLHDMLVAYTGGYFVSGRTDCDKNNSLPGCNSSGYFYSGTPPKGSDNNFNPKEDFAEIGCGLCVSDKGARRSL